MKSFSSINMVGAVIIGVIMIVVISSFIMKNADIPSLDSFVASTTAMDLADATENGGEIKKLDFGSMKRVEVVVPKGKISALIASSTDELETGLSFQDDLPENGGMLFVFSTRAQYGFWMKDMKFPLDIVWMDSTKKVIEISDNIRPETYPEVFSPVEPVMYVLEINAGAAKKLGIATSSTLKFNLP